MDKIASLYNEEIIATLKDVKSLLSDIKTKEAQVIFKDSQTVTGSVEVSNKISADVSNISEVTDKLEAVIKAVEASKSDIVTLSEPLMIKNLDEVSLLLTKLIETKTNVSVTAPDVHVEAPIVKVNTPETIKVDWPRSADDPIAVRLSDGKDFIKQLTQSIVAGGGSRSPFSKSNGDAAYITLNTDGSLPVTPLNTLVPTRYDDIQVTYPSSATEVYAYYLAGDVVAEVTITYQDSTKAKLTRAQRTI